MNIRLYHPNSIVENKTSLLSKEHTHYVVNVLRVKRGSNLYFFNKNGEWKSEIIFLDKDRVEVKFLDKVKKPINAHDVQLAICLVKKNPLDIILQKSTELGVSKIIPLISERSEVRELNYDRAKKIVIEATEQSNQLNPPSIAQTIKLDEFLKNISEKTKLLFADINFKEKIDYSNLKKSKSLIILIGPEGDFSPKERRLITSKENVIPFSLSKNILRTDTAVISAISLINFILNDH
tara:strand:- start:991 stop:1701 length:711 start_codon:yes stop_codon:yes gene_type:complete